MWELIKSICDVTSAIAKGFYNGLRDNPIILYCLIAIIGASAIGAGIMHLVRKLRG